VLSAPLTKNKLSLVRQLRNQTGKRKLSFNVMTLILFQFSVLLFSTNFLFLFIKKKIQPIYLIANAGSALYFP